MKSDPHRGSLQQFSETNVYSWSLRCCWISVEKDEFGPVLCTELARVSWFLETLLLGIKNTFLPKLIWVCHDNASTSAGGVRHCGRPSAKKWKKWAHRNREMTVADLVDHFTTSFNTYFWKYLWVWALKIFLDIFDGPVLRPFRLRCFYIIVIRNRLTEGLPPHPVSINVWYAEKDPGG